MSRVRRRQRRGRRAKTEREQVPEPPWVVKNEKKDLLLRTEVDLPFLVSPVLVVLS